MKSRFRSVKEAMVYLGTSPRLTNTDVWNIVTALRGPDNESLVLKDKTTAVIRGFLFHNSIPGATVKTGFGSGVLSAIKDNHFGRHARRAVVALRKIRKAARE